MKFLVENSPNNSLCSLKICYNKMSSKQCLFHCSFQWFIPEYLNNTATAVNIPFLEDDNVTESCTPNTWLWVVDNSEEGIAHFIVGNNIIDNVSVAHFNNYLITTRFRLDIMERLVCRVLTSLWSV